ncbi:MAG: sigma 54-interacting transcriptional regulator [Deltaproteobacteria bacterium]|nr:sigma 54-interacting transcriptional regulator [Deltaproteobacteria bacterium]
MQAARLIARDSSREVSTLRARSRTTEKQANRVALDPARCRDPILDSINEGVFTVDLDWRITSFNRAAERITGIRREDAIGRRCSEVLRANICQDACVMKRVLHAKKPAVDASVFIVDATGERIPIKVSAAILRDTDGRVMGGVETFQDLRQVEELRKRLRDKHTFVDIVGKSRAITQIFDILPHIADTDATVLVQGASGTGKELVARAIHALSPRRKKPFVAVNCGALPDTLLESELFGYRAGAFTDARRDKPGRFALADGGTLFLDEIGDISAAMQVRLLRVLQEKAYEPLGAVEPVRADVRIIAATNRDLGEMVRAGKFREDLYYRIHVVQIDVPPLKERREDIPILVDHLIATYNRVHDQEITGLSQEALALLVQYDYPGNVRELQNILEHAFVLCRGGTIEPRHLPSEVARGSARETVDAWHGMNLRTTEKALIREALAKHGGSRALAAGDLGIDPSTLYRKIQKLGIVTPAQDGRGKRAHPTRRKPSPPET